DGNIVFAAYADGGKLMLTSTGDGLVHVWDAQNGKRLRTFGEKIAPQTSRPPSNPWEDDEDMFEFRHSGQPVTAKLAASPDGKTVAIKFAGKPDIHLWDVASGKDQHTVSLGGKRS